MTAVDPRLHELCVALHREWFADPVGAAETAMCLPASLALIARLQAAGYQDALLVYGTFTLDDPDPATYDDASVDGEPPAYAYAPVHWWVRVRETLCDITAGQYADECEQPIAPVRVLATSDPAAWRYTPLPDAPAVDLDPADAAWVREHGHR